MKITAFNPVSAAGKEPRKNGRRISLRVVLLVAMAASLFFSLLTYGLVTEYFPNGIRSGLRDIAKQEYGYKANGSDIHLRDALMKVPERLARNVDVRKIFIDIGFTQLQKLYAKREEAISAGLLVQQPDDFVPASIRVGEDTVKVKLRLKGDWIDHLEKDKWSFRIHTKGEGQLFGMRRFSIQHPATRGYQGEVIFHETLRQFGVLTPRYFFLDVVINGDDVGIMALEEQFSKELLERNGRKEGVIVRFDESLLWNERLGSDKGKRDEVFNSFLNTSLDSFQSSKIKKSEYLYSMYELAVGLIRGFNSGYLKASEVFDAEQLGRYLGVAEFWGAWHEVIWHNQRFYLNPLTLKLEPIAFDADLQGRRPIGSTIITREPIISRMLEDPEVEASFQRTLDRLVYKVENGDLIERLKRAEKVSLDILQKEYVLLESFDYEELRQRARNIPERNIPKRNLPDMDPDKYSTFIHAYLIEDNGRSYLELSNALPRMVEVQSIGWVDKSGNTLPFELKAPLDYPVVLPETLLGTNPVAHRYEYQPLASRVKHRLEVKVNIQGYNKVQTTTAVTYFPPLRGNPMPIGDIKELLKRHPFLSSVDDARITVTPGQWKVRGNIVIPIGYQLEVPAGTTLQFEEGGGLIVYGTTMFRGTEMAPVILEGRQEDGDDKGEWQGVAIYNAPDRSQWSHVTVRNTTGMKWPFWELTGGVTFYQSDVDMNHCTFTGNKGEDALNIIHSDFNLNDVSIYETISDGFDGDFTTGTVSGGQFQDIGMAGGGDAVDVSGSEVTIDGAHFIRVNDKAISVGEGSTVTAVNVVADDCSVGAASKDDSRMDISDSTIKNAGNAALMAYTKKPEFGPATLVAKNITILDTKESAIVQQGNYLELNGELIDAERLDVRNLYQTIMKPGLSK